LVLGVHEFFHSDRRVRRIRSSMAPTTASASGCHLDPKHKKQISVLSNMIYTRDEKI
jgi:hypothetical protein